MTTFVRKSPRQFGEEIERLQQQGKWTLEAYLRLWREVVELYGSNSGILDALSHNAAPEWRDRVIREA